MMAIFCLNYGLLTVFCTFNFNFILYLIVFGQINTFSSVLFFFILIINIIDDLLTYITCLDVFKENIKDWTYNNILFCICYILEMANNSPSVVRCHNAGWMLIHHLRRCISIQPALWRAHHYNAITTAD